MKQYPRATEVEKQRMNVIFVSPNEIEVLNNNNNNEKHNVLYFIRRMIQSIQSGHFISVLFIATCANTDAFWLIH